MKYKILLSAYSCEPNLGSEAEIGWSWVKYLSKTNNKVYVITRKSNRKKIKKFKFNNIKFFYYDLPDFFIYLIKGGKGKSNSYLYFYVWQIAIFLKFYRFIKLVKFDYIHHVTLGSFRIPSFLCLFKAKFIFGPVAGGETVHRNLTKKFSNLSKLKEIIRYFSNLCVKYSIFTNLTFYKSHKIYLTSKDCIKFVPKKYHKKCIIFPAISTDKLFYEIKNKKKFYNIYFAGRLVEWKGIRLLLDVYKNLHRNKIYINLKIFGNGDYKSEIIKFINRYNLKKIRLFGHLEQKKYFAQIKKTDLLVFPTLRDSGGYVIIEALKNNIDVITSNAGGPSTIIKKNSIGLVNIKNKSYENVVRDFTKKITDYYFSSKKRKYQLNKFLKIENKYKSIYS
jgi:glycosyltransferase involved in cell wall biosynthesis